MAALPVCVGAGPWWKVKPFPIIPSHIQPSFKTDLKNNPMQARHLQLAYMKEHSLCVWGGVYIALFMRRERELAEVQLVPCASRHGLVSSFPWVFILSLFYFISISCLMLFRLAIMRSPHFHCQPLDGMCCASEAPILLHQLSRKLKWLIPTRTSILQPSADRREMAPAAALWRRRIDRQGYRKRWNGTGLANISSQHSMRYCSPL